MLPLLMLIEGSRALSRERVFRDRNNAFDCSDEHFVRNYRLDKESVFWLVERIRLILTEKRQTVHTLSVEEKVLLTLKFYGTGSFQHSVGNDYCIAVSQSTVSRAITAVTDAILQTLLPEVILFPDDMFQVKEKFFDMCQLPNIIGVIDCTHIYINCPRENGEAYINRKGRHSVNVQLVCDADHKIMDIVAKWPGSTDDAYIWLACNLRERLLRLDMVDGYLLGDSEYPLESCLITPVHAPATPQEMEFNSRHVQGRGVIDRVNGILKSRFRCLHVSGGVLQYSPLKVCQIVAVCAILHNLCLVRNVQLPDGDLSAIEDNDNDGNDMYHGDGDPGGLELQRQLISLC